MLDGSRGFDIFAGAIFALGMGSTNAGCRYDLVLRSSYASQPRL
jgi:hypothetical protein